MGFKPNKMNEEGCLNLLRQPSDFCERLERI